MAGNLQAGVQSVGQFEKLELQKPADAQGLQRILTRGGENQRGTVTLHPLGQRENRPQRGTGQSLHAGEFQHHGFACVLIHIFPQTRVELGGVVGVELTGHGEHIDPVFDCFGDFHE